MTDLMFLYDDVENTRTRFVSFMGETNRFDLAIITTERFYGKLLVLNLQSSRFAIIGSDDLEEPGYLEHVYQLSEEEAEELRHFLHTLI
ncbi:DUF3055 domain-containing protein [Thermoflavimicrobium daqui]|jgi:hypothetical protein|uniref:Cytosolic protein n=1 Tax=Thermoflavimicrobium daqui TaxID=2137476 RepID=A0A364K9N3_9BACL|nr:DUF3055 domain-containing protein [Thermoflavimicrobium daqui]RAL27005.1 cytosolic protein [Thermoflavimicrobium daqui]